MLEAFVIAVCVSGGPGCKEVTQQYYDNNAELKAWVKKEQGIVETTFGKDNLAVLGTSLGLAFVRKGTFQIDSHLSLELGSENKLEAKWEY